MTLSDIKKTAVIGAGLIGSAWATAFSRAGYKVNLYDINPQTLTSGLDNIRCNLELFANSGVMDKSQIEDALARITLCDNLEDALKDVQFIQESVPDKIELKKDIIKKIDEYNTAAILSTSASWLKLSDIAADSPYANRCVGGHPFNPPHLMPLVEITHWEKTDPNLVQTAYEFYLSVGKVPIILQKETLGFIANRLQAAYVREAIALVKEGICSVEDVDMASVYGLGVRYAILGPYLNSEMNAPGGVGDFFGAAYGAGFSAGFKRLAECSITSVPEDLPQLATEGVEIQKAKRPKETGNTRDEIIAHRDKLLIEILKLHNKL